MLLPNWAISARGFGGFAGIGRGRRCLSMMGRYYIFNDDDDDGD